VSCASRFTPACTPRFTLACTPLCYIFIYPRFAERLIRSMADEQEIRRIFSQVTDKAWSYTDCACRVLAHRRGIGQAFTFDRHFAQMRLEMAPDIQP